MSGLSQTRAYLALLAIVALWGSYPATSKLALADFPPFFLGVVRCTLASAFLVYLLARSSAGLPRPPSAAVLRDFLILGVAGIWGSTQWTYVAIYYTTAASAALLQAAAPVIVAVAARLYLGERLSRLGWTGVGVSALGVLLVVTRGRLVALRVRELHAGDFIMLLALCGWAAYTVYGKRVLATHSPALATTAAYVLGTALLVPTALGAAPLFPRPRLASWVGWAVVLYHGLIGAVAHVWWYRAVQVVGPSRSAAFMNLQPLVGVALAVGLLAEAVSGWQVAGGALVLAGVALTTRGGLTPPARPTRVS